MEKKDLIEIFDLVLKSHGFVRKAKAWYKRSAGTSFVVDLQKSNYGEQYYANLALIPGGVSVAGDPFPKEHHCPIRSRLSAVADEGQS